MTKQITKLHLFKNDKDVIVFVVDDALVVVKDSKVAFCIKDGVVEKFDTDDVKTFDVYSGRTYVEEIVKVNVKDLYLLLEEIETEEVESLEDFIKILKRK